jgi:cystathionine beta-lyase/cystathionine gamma-synthase
MSRQELKASGISHGLVRVAIGIENWRDLLRDFTLALG